MGNSKWCSICLRNNYRLHLSGNNQTKGPTVPGQNGKSTCSNKDRNGKYQFHGRFQPANDSLRDVVDWVKGYSTYCKYAQGLYVNKEFLANMGLTDPKDYKVFGFGQVKQQNFILCFQILMLYTINKVGT